MPRADLWQNTPAAEVRGVGARHPHSTSNGGSDSVTFLMVGRHPPGNQPETQSDKMRSRDLRTLLARPASMDPRENKRGDWPCCEEAEARIDYVGPAPQHKGDWSYRFRSVRRSPPSVSPSMSPLTFVLVFFPFPSWVGAGVYVEDIYSGACSGTYFHTYHSQITVSTHNLRTPQQLYNIKRQRSVIPLWRRTIAR